MKTTLFLDIIGRSETFSEHGCRRGGKIDDFHLAFLNPFLFRYKLGAILDFRNGILDLRNAVYFKMIERSDSTNPKSEI